MKTGRTLWKVIVWPADRVLRHNTSMADVSIYVAVVSASAAVAGAMIFPLTIALRESRQAERDRQERHAKATYQACVRLLSAAGDLRMQVANNHSYRGDRNAMTARLEDVRRYAAAARLHAAKVSLLSPNSLAESADELASAAKSYADEAAKLTDLDHGWMSKEPDHRKLEACIRAFRTNAVDEAKARS